ncbi:hypothetical protein [Streptomyces sp. NBC_00441]|uniref:hypothetical protein n=1 Tax=Streptomyces sp. NBC_00441 TaxID=2975742 RepID=UPI002E2B4AEF|nr:hypothetical protein [Streptomyces sp. NBC_00441]
MDFEPFRGELMAYCYRMPAFTAAEQLGTTVAAVNSALQRARAALAEVADAGAVAEPDDPGVRAVVQRYVRAFEAADVPALVRLLADDAVPEMPPVPLWHLGSGDYGRFMERVFAMRGTGWAVRGAHRQWAARARGVRAGARRWAPSAHLAGLHRDRRPGGAQRGLRRSARLRRLRPAVRDFREGFPPGAMSPGGAAGRYR